MELYFLGTGAGTPTIQRNVSSIALKLMDKQARLWLFDCGEGTQQQILHSPIKLHKLEKIFITHLHGDHLYGLPGLLTTRSNQGCEVPITLYGPKGIKNFVETALTVSGSRIIYPLTIQEIDPGVIYHDSQISVETQILDHRIESYGYRITESEQLGQLYYDKLKQMGIPEGPLYGKLKQGHDIQLKDGTVIRSVEMLGPQIPGRIITILGDTRSCEATIQLAENADVIVHEATFSAELSELANKYFHSTTEDAAHIASQARAKALILTHISSRYQQDSEQMLLDQAKSIFPNTMIAKDFWSYWISKK